LDALDAERLLLHIARRLHAVAVESVEGRHVEAADEEAAVDWVEAVHLGADAGGIGQRLLDRLSALLLDLLLPHHRDALRRFEDRRRGLGAGRALRGDITVDRAP